MCLVTFQREPYLVKEDMIVYKEMIFAPDDYVYSSTRCFKYKIGVLYKTNMEIFLLSEDALPNLKRNKRLIRIYEGFHSCLTSKEGYIRKGVKITPNYRCIIPKGSLIFFNIISPELCVSNQIIIKEHI